MVDFPFLFYVLVANDPSLFSGCRSHRKDLHVVVQGFVSLDLLIRQGNKVLLTKPSDEESAADDVIGQAIFIQQRAVHRQAKELSIRIAHQGNRLLERVHGFNISAYDPLHICETIDLLNTAGLLRFYN
jgi:hypothetical protein